MSTAYRAWLCVVVATVALAGCTTSSPVAGPTAASATTTVGPTKAATTTRATSAEATTTAARTTSAEPTSTFSREDWSAMSSLLDSMTEWASGLHGKCDSAELYDQVSCSMDLNMINYVAGQAAATYRSHGPSPPGLQAATERFLEVAQAFNQVVSLYESHCRETADVAAGCVEFGLKAIEAAELLDDARKGLL